MDPSLQPLLQRLEQLSGQFPELRDGVQEAIRIADISPEMAVTRARKVLEYVVRDVYERRINEPPGTRPLENLLQRLVKDGYFPDRLDAYASTIRKLGNVGTHSFAERLEMADVYQSLAQLLPILEWYFEIERPEALGGHPAPRTGEPPSRPRAEPPGASARRLAIVPKGLRSFDAHDADFFLDLLPGPRDKDGLPDSIRFWKHRIEADGEAAFTVGVIYGPSGCGKSSLTKAGLLPRLGGGVLATYVEATAEETEFRLLKALRTRFPNLPTDVDLLGAITALRQGNGVAPGPKLLIVIDQFEQWLHSRRGEQNTELAQALRQCDGEHVQCLLLVRDDFWLALSRFMADLHVELVQGQNSALVDLFDPLHARQVLEAFGRALGRLTDHPSKDEQAFVEQAIRGLTQDGRVISVRLALFAEMVKGRPWTPATLKAVGGTEGVGLAFLEETFSAANARADHRGHQQATRGVLKALLPASGTDIKGHMRSYAELLALSGYSGQPRDFDQLIRILDGEVRLITPTDPDGRETDALAPTPARGEGSGVAGEKYYQLTHDYLVHSLRDWLTRKQRETRRGRAELRLTERAAPWSITPENRFLPSLREFLSIRALTDRTQWTETQQQMMVKARRVHAVRSGVVAATLFVAALIGLNIRNAVVERQNATRAEGLVDAASRAEISKVPAILSSLKPYRTWANPLLRSRFEQAPEGSAERLNLSLALLSVDAAQVKSLRDQLLVVAPQQFPIVRDALLNSAPGLAAGVPPLSWNVGVVEPLWQMALDTKQETQRRFQAACALAAYAPSDPRWNAIASFVAGQLVTLEASDFSAWRVALRSVKDPLRGPLTLIYHDKSQRDQNRTYATEALADYAAAEPDELFELLATAETFQFPAIFARLKGNKAQVVGLAQAELAKSAPKEAREDDKETLAQRQANAAVALLNLGAAEQVWPLLKGPTNGQGTLANEATVAPATAFAQNWDLRLRSSIIHSMAPLGGDPKTIINRLAVEPDATIRRALTLALGEFSESQWPVAQRQPVIDSLLAVFENEPDAGLHAAAEWLLRRWQQGDRLQAVLARLRPPGTSGQATSAGRPWLVNSQSQTFVILDAGEVLMGSPASEPFRNTDETQHRVHIGRQFAIATTHVTRAQYRAFQQAVQGADLAHKPELADIVLTDDSPQVGVTWYEAAQYCNWLSQQEGLPECYAPNAEGEYGPGMHPQDHYLQLAGYRLPTEAEWEFACRACTATSRYYGLSEALLPKYACYLTNSQNHAWPVVSFQPNDFGLFDMHGNAWQWCDSAYQSYPLEADRAAEDLGSTDPVVDLESRVLRGGSFLTSGLNVRSAYHNGNQPTNRANSRGVGFRPVRTWLPSDVPLHDQKPAAQVARPANSARGGVDTR